MVELQVPDWLRLRIAAAGGAVSFATYMDWVLHDAEHGAYGAGKLRIGPEGDFATSPSLGPDFAGLLAVQLADWLGQFPHDQPLGLVEAGPGEGSLALDLAWQMQRHWPDLAGRLSLVLVEPNPGMAERQRTLLSNCPLPLRWSTFAELAADPVQGVVLAHEVLDALAVERIVWSDGKWCQQLVCLVDGDAEASLQLLPGPALSPAADGQLVQLGLLPANPQRGEGWSSELHPGLEPWLGDCAAALSAGMLLVVDYAHEAWRYYAPPRSEGTLMAYRDQRASGDPLLDPGSWDLTAHICIESLEAAAAASGWQALGQCRQGQALLALGLAERLHGLQQLELGELLPRREALLRLVDPIALGDFRWLAFSRNQAPLQPLFSREPGPPTTAADSGQPDRVG
ncbi:SAM-dependent methyltransferase [Cyanobium sp. WAJ14-Wanaka]|uniref:class I SAM-dependent methyltransferase n=1 Tax=Cyanobium sp. WAJ14-Wanaka TaxID=2823725 RepID=UPI0020CD0E1E|nr:SAM-dependent methyltransferase [Cyanobium sp. WAJ14-Wanaka]